MEPEYNYDLIIDILDEWIYNNADQASYNYDPTKIDDVLDFINLVEEMKNGTR
jgi:hypothetical protein